MSKSDLFDTFVCGSDEFYVDYKPVAPISQRSTIEFVVPPSQVHYIDLKKSRICISAQLLDAKNQPLTNEQVMPLPRYKKDGSEFTDEEFAEHEKGRASPVSLLLSSMFNQVDVSLNQNIVARTVGSNYPFKAYIDTLLYRGSYQLEKTLAATEFYIKPSDPNSFDNNLSMFAYAHQYTNGAILDLEGPIHNDIFALDKCIPSNVEVKVKLFQSQDAFRINAPTPDNECKINILDASLRICYLQLTPEQTIQNEAMLTKTPAVYDYRRSDFKVYQLPQGSFSATFENIYNVCPLESIIALVPSQGYSGSYTENPFNFKNYGVNFIELSVDNVSQPAVALKPNFAKKNYSEAYLRLFDSHVDNQQLGIHFEDFPDGFSLFRFELSPKKGNVRISLRFSEALPEGVSLILYSKFRSHFQIDDSRNVIEE